MSATARTVEHVRKVRVARSGAALSELTLRTIKPAERLRALSKPGEQCLLLFRSQRLNGRVEIFDEGRGHEIRFNGILHALPTRLLLRTADDLHVIVSE